MRRAVEIRRELAVRRRDPLREAIRGLTPDQRRFVEADNREKVGEGGNQSGKTWAACISFLLRALGIEQKKRGQAPALQNWKGWYATTTYERFAEQAWGHWKRLLLFPGEGTGKLPTRRILAIGWDKKSPERPQYVKLRREDGGEADIYIKSYEQGAGEFQAAEVDCLVLDEECPDSIYEEAQPRVLVRRGKIIVAATPVLGVGWLERLRADAESGKADVFHTRFDTRDNPAASPAEIESLERRWRDFPELIKLRLQGYPLSLEGAIYPDSRFTRAHVVEPFAIPYGWTRYVAVDEGYLNCAALYGAVNPGGEVYFYREYFGRERNIEENARAIKSQWERQERFRRQWIDPSALGKSRESGRRRIDLWREAGLDVSPAPNNRQLDGIERVWELLAEKGPDGVRPRMFVFSSLTNFLRERRTYRWHDPRPRGDEKPDRVMKREDHVMDCWRYLVAAGLEYVPPGPVLPPRGTLGRRLAEKRRPRKPRIRL